MKKYAKKFTYAKKKGLVCCLILIILGGLFIPASDVTAEDRTYLLNFDLYVEDALYVFVNPYFDLRTWENGFLIEYVLDYNGVQIVESISYSEDGYKETASFKKIEVPYDAVEVEYYTENNVLVDDCHLRYHLILREDPDLGKMILSVPRLCSLGDEKILQVVDGEGYPLNTLYATEADLSGQEQIPPSDTDTVSLSKEDSVESSEADETPEDESAAPDAVVEERIDQPIAEENLGNIEEQASDGDNTILAEPEPENLPETKVDENAVPENSPVVPELDNILLQAPQPSPLKAPSTAEYELTFNLYRPSSGNSILEDFIIPEDSYYGQHEELRNSGDLTDFDVKFNLFINRQEPPIEVASMHYNHENSLEHWSKITFDNIKIPYQQVDIEYYAEGGEYVEPYRMSYDLYLDESPSGDKMILKLPRLKPNRHEYEKMPNVTNLSTKPAHALYLGGENADDNNSGLKEELPLASFAKAKELATIDQRINSIFLNKTLEIEGDFSLAGTNAELLRGDTFYGHLLKVSPGRTANLHDITLDGNKNHSLHVNSALIWVDGGTLNIDKGTLLKDNNNMVDRTPTEGGGIRASNGAIINMTGGSIQQNRATFGGGIYLNHSTLNFSAGTIQNNTTELVTETETTQEGQTKTVYDAAGGGICADNGSTIEMYDNGKILSNASHERGGGISLGTNKLASGSTLIMRGGLIDGNRAGATGGGIFIQLGEGCEPSKAYILGGRITGNITTGKGSSEKAFGGGGIYVNGSEGSTYTKGELHLTNAVITGNTCAKIGAGYAACPCSQTSIFVNDGCALFGNQADWAANELYSLANIYYGLHLGNPSYEIPQRALSGIPYNWENEDGSLLPHDKLSGTITKNNDYLALHTEQRANELTSKLATVWITGNHSATNGGGIGSNGTVIIGKPGTTEVSVRKNWDDNNDADGMRPESITVDLMAELDGENYVVDSANLNAGNNWSYIFKDLPTKYGEYDFRYAIRESAVEGYTGQVSGNAQSGFVITNHHSTETTPPPPSVTVSSPIVFKQIAGGQPDTADLFTFRIEPVSYKPDPAYPRTESNALPLPQGEQGAVQEVQISGEGTASTGKITYKQPGYYEYKIQEIATGDNKYIYSTDVYTFVDHVYMQDGQLAVDRTMYRNEQKANTTTAYFTNQYQGEPGPQEKVTSLPATGELTHLSLDLTLLGIGVLTLIQKKHGR